MTRVSLKPAIDSASVVSRAQLPRGVGVVDLDEIYDAAFDRELFPALLGRLLSAMGAQCGFLAWVDMESDARFEVEVGNDPTFLQSYLETYAAKDLMRPVLQNGPEGVVLSAYELLQTPQVRDSVFYREWLAPQGIVDNLATNLIKREQMFATLAIIRTGDVLRFSEPEIAELQRIIPHLRRAVFMQSRLVQQANLVSGYRRITQGTRNGLVLLDEQLRVLDVDRSTQALTGTRVGQLAGATAFGEAMKAAIRDDAPVVIEAAQDDAAPVTLLCVAQSLERDPFGDLTAGPGVAHAVHVLRVDQAAQIAFTSLASLYGLTPTEARVMTDAFTNADLTGIGDRLGMARATARTHLHRIYDKTQTQSFAGLCMLAHRFTLPA